MANTAQDIKDCKQELNTTLEDTSATNTETGHGDGEAEEKAHVKSVYNKYALIALIIAIVAWGVLLIPALYSGYAALGLGVAGIIFAAIGLKSPRRGWRDLSTTALIANTVLAIVIISFLVVIYVGLNGI